MKSEICNNCGNNLGVLDKGHIFENRIVCGKCIKVLCPSKPKPKLDLVEIAAKAREGATESIKADEDAKYENAKRRVVFFLSGVISLFWFIIWLHIIAVVVVLVAIIAGFGK